MSGFNPKVVIVGFGVDRRYWNRFCPEQLGILLPVIIPPFFHTVCCQGLAQ
jgi:hypothetical protein